MSADFRLPDDFVEILDNFKLQTRSRTRGEALRKAMIIAANIANELDDGSEITIKYKDGSERNVVLSSSDE